jgi:hypothetical protein
MRLAFLPSCMTGSAGVDRDASPAWLRASLVLLLLVAPPLVAQTPPPRFMYIYRDFVKSGADSVYRATEDRGARICADLKCPNPYLALESLSGPHEAWWLNAFSTEADTIRVVKAYAANRELAESLGAVAKHKETLIGTPIQGFGIYRVDLSRGPTWSVAGARFMLITVTHSREPAEGSVWEMADHTLYVFRPLRTAAQANALTAGKSARVFAVRPNWSMPAPEWVAADPEFWRLASLPKPRR